MDQSPPQFGNIAADRGALAAALGLAEDDLVPGDPAQVVATGASHLLVRRGQLEAGPAVIEQGRALGRPSRIQVRASGPSVTVSGSGLISAEGFLHL
jgi:predicted PhzF superfamily epimerase YddE/YHI9